MNARDLLMAFEKAATFTLFIDGKRLDPSTFGKYLSRASVGKVLTAYKEFSQGNKARPQGYKTLQLAEAPKKKITPEEAYSLILKWVQEDGEFPVVAPYRSCYQYLLEKNVVKPINSTKSKGRFSQMIGAQMDVNPYRRTVEEYLSKNL